MGLSNYPETSTAEPQTNSDIECFKARSLLYFKTGDQQSGKWWLSRAIDAANKEGFAIPLSVIENITEGKAPTGVVSPESTQSVETPKTHGKKLNLFSMESLREFEKELKRIIEQIRAALMLQRFLQSISPEAKTAA